MPAGYGYEGSGSRKMVKKKVKASGGEKKSLYEKAMKKGSMNSGSSDADKKKSKGY